ncbi:MAG: DUF885 domain-containing protein [Acidobacteriota bacterium]|nr:DUF885 domain-containing protein [Acidobacteriota bacterium]
MHTSEPLSHFANEYLQFLYETSPTAASGDGVHTHDDRLEDLSRAAIDTHGRELSGFARRLDRISTRSLTAEEQLERRMLADHIRGRLFDLEEIRPWERDPQHYADLLATSLAGQTLLEHAPVEERARRVVSKLRQTPRLLEAAEANVEDPPSIFIKIGAETFDGVVTFIERDLPRAFRQLEDLHLLGDLADAATEATAAITRYTGYLRETLAPRSRATFRLGQDRLEGRLRHGDGISVGVDRLLVIAERELGRTHERFREVAGKIDAKAEPGEVWAQVKSRHPAPGEVAQTVRGQLDDLRSFIERNALVSVPAEESIVVAPTPEFYRWTLASVCPPGPFEPRVLPTYYYVTEAHPSWSPERCDEHLRDLNFATLLSVSVHETYPGHHLHFHHLRGLKSALRKSLLFAPVSFVEGWAHYVEQMMMEAGLAQGDDTLELAQVAESLLRLSRLVVSIRLHAEDMSVEQGVRFFREEAFLEEASARREAERGTFDPDYALYAIGRLMLLKLREDLETREGSAFSLKTFHDRLLGQGAVPLWLHRTLLLGDTGDELLE